MDEVDEHGVFVLDVDVFGAFGLLQLVQCPAEEEDGGDGVDKALGAQLVVGISYV